MSQRITIQILDKIATCLTELPIVCGNSDYVVDFVFDEEWDKHDVKTAVFKVNGKPIKKVFRGNECEIPAMRNTLVVTVGVFAGTIDDGTLSTSTSALVRCKPCATDGDDVPPPPPDDVYNQIVGLCDEAVSTAKSVEERANNGEFDGKDGKQGEKGEDGHTPVNGVDYNTPEEKAAFVKEVEDACLGDIDTALDSIIAIQESLIGGDTE